MLQHPVLLLQVLPSLQDCLKEVNQVPVLSKVAKLVPQVPIHLALARDNVPLLLPGCSTPAESVSLCKSAVMGIVSRKLLYAESCPLYFPTLPYRLKYSHYYSAIDNSIVLLFK